MSSDLSTQLAVKLANGVRFPLSASLSAPRYFGRSTLRRTVNGYPLLISMVFVRSLAVLPFPSMKGCM